MIKEDSFVWISSVLGPTKVRVYEPLEIQPQTPISDEFFLSIAEEENVILQSLERFKIAQVKYL